MTTRIATPPLERFPYLITTQTLSSAFSESLPEPFAYMPEEKFVHVFEGKSISHLEAGFFVFFSQSLSQFISFLMLLLSPCWPIICFTARGWYLSTPHRLGSPAQKKKEKITFTVKIQCRFKKIKQNKTKKQKNCTFLYLNLSNKQVYQWNLQLNDPTDEPKGGI